MKKFLLIVFSVSSLTLTIMVIWLLRLPETHTHHVKHHSGMVGVSTYHKQSDLYTQLKFEDRQPDMISAEGIDQQWVKQYTKKKVVSIDVLLTILENNDSHSF